MNGFMCKWCGRVQQQAKPGDACESCGAVLPAPGPAAAPAQQAPSLGQTPTPPRPHRHDGLWIGFCIALCLSLLSNVLAVVALATGMRASKKPPPTAIGYIRHLQVRQLELVTDNGKIVGQFSCDEMGGSLELGYTTAARASTYVGPMGVMLGSDKNSAWLAPSGLLLKEDDHVIAVLKSDLWGGQLKVHSKENFEHKAELNGSNGDGRPYLLIQGRKGTRMIQ